jgi:hypothetical protein
MNTYLSEDHNLVIDASHNSKGSFYNRFFLIYYNTIKDKIRYDTIKHNDGQL